MDELTSLLTGHQAGVLQHGQMLGHGRFRDLEPRRDLARRQVGMGQIGQDLAPDLAGEGFEHALHGKTFK